MESSIDMPRCRQDLTQPPPTDEQSEARAAAVLAVLAVLVGCGSVSPLERTLPIALSQHTTPLQTASLPPVPVVMPHSVLWNRVASAVAQACGVAQEDDATGLIESHPCYSTPEPSSGLVSRQRRTRITVRLLPTGTDLSSLSIQATTEQRERAAGQAPTAWRAAALDAEQVAVLRRAIETAVQNQRPADIRELAFEETPDEVVRRIAPRLSPYVEGERTGEGFVTDWRVTSEDMRPGTLWLRSRIRVIVEASDGGSRVSVVGQLQQRVEEAGSRQSTVAPEWTDIDPASITAHGVAVVAETLVARAVHLPEESIQTYASAPAPEPALDDPSAEWRATQLPSGVAATTETAVGEVMFPEGARPGDLIGTVYDASMRPMRGRVIPVGELTQTPQPGVRTLFRQIEFESEMELGASYFGLGATARRDRAQRIAVFTSLAEQDRLEIPQYANFEQVPPDASYYVAGVIVGRTLDLALQADENTIRVAIGLQYQGFRAQLQTRNRRSTVRCALRSRGFTTTTACAGESLPAQEVLQQEVSNAHGAVPVLLIVRRVPDRFRAGSPRMFDLELRGVSVSQSNQGLFEGEIDIRIRIDRGSDPQHPWTQDCPDGRRSCTLDPAFRLAGIPEDSAERLRVTLTDVDTIADDRLERFELSVNELIPSGPRERRPVSVCDWIEHSRGNSTLTVCVHEQ